MNKRYAAFIAAHGEQPSWCYVIFISAMKSRFTGSVYGRIIDHDEFTRFIEDNASSYSVKAST